jgi:hypothetical protein
MTVIMVASVPGGQPSERVPLGNFVLDQPRDFLDGIHRAGSP